MLLDNFVCHVKILTVLKLNWDSSDADAAPRKFHALSFRTKGNAHYTLGTQEVSVQTGDILFVPENLAYHIKADQEELYVIHFELPEKAQSCLEIFPADDYPKTKKLFAACYDVWNKKEPGYYFKTLSVFYNILERMTVSALNTTTDATHKKLMPAMDYLHGHFTDPDLSVLTLCDLIHVSDTWLRKLFVKCYGTKPAKYINQLRIAYAKELLESGYYKIETIAEMAGFQDAKYFSTVFKHHTGCTPSDYKRTFENPPEASSQRGIDTRH